MDVYDLKSRMACFVIAASVLNGSQSLCQPMSESAKAASIKSKVAPRPNSPFSFPDGSLNFGNYHLGMSLADLKKMPPPPSTQADYIPYFGTDSVIGNETHGSFVNAVLLPFWEQYNVEFYFYGSNNQNQKLVRISGPVRADDVSVISATLSGLYGEPSPNEPLDSNHHAHQEWKRGDQVIVLKVDNPVDGTLAFVDIPAWAAREREIEPVLKKRADDKAAYEKAQAIAKQQAEEKAKDRQQQINNERDEKIAKERAYIDQRNQLSFAHQKDTPELLSERGVLGISFDNNTHAITNISSDSDFATNGAQVGDVIIAVDGFPYRETDYLIRALMGKPNSQVRVMLQRGNETKEVTAMRHLKSRTN